jgi:hypothetical protein
LQAYARPDAFLDWGDDPALYSASEICGDVRLASWGVCRRDLRANLKAGDVVLFFCAVRLSESWSYHLVGFETVMAVISRRDIWGSLLYARYRGYFNVLARPEGAGWAQAEVFHPWHSDWERRMANYVLFDPDPEKTTFRMFGAPKVATYQDGEGVPEKWSKSKLAQSVESLVFSNPQVTRRLRTSRIGFAHRHLRVTEGATEATELRSRLKALLDEG